MNTTQRALKTVVLWSVAGAAGSVLACSSIRAETPKAAKPAGQSAGSVSSGAQASAPAVISQAEKTGEKNVAVPSPDEAKRLAEQHVALRKRSWGQAKEVSEHGESYWVSFETPDQELRLLGPRIIVVDKQTGAAAVQLRR